MVLVDKPPGWTSHDVVGWLRARLRTRRVGHAGTLDPLATGLLPCLVGPATRLTRWLHGWPKTYVGQIVLGLETPTGDAEGVDLSAVEPVPLPPAAVLARARTALTGEIEQAPPAFSAKKLRGVPAHRIARRGGGPDLAPVRVTVHRLRFQRAGEGRLLFAARVSSGTYLRSLARDLGRLVGTGAFLASLRRTGIGPLRVRGAIRPLPRAERRAGQVEPPPELLAPECIPLPMPAARIGGREADRFRHGQALAPPPEVAGAPPGSMVRVLSSGVLVGIGELEADGRLRPRVVLPATGAGA